MLSSLELKITRKRQEPEGSDIARPAEFLVDTSGTVRWTNFTEDFRIRAKADEMLARRPDGWK